jgi:3-hydroxy-9,10-secoandrosta-1,3,5(10)-triene-9,17-dione monooxygenase
METEAATGRKILSHEEIVRRSRELAPSIAGRVMETEAQRRVPKASVDEIVRSGVVEALVPERWGGYGLDWRTLIEATAEIGRVCGSTAWCFSFFLGHQWLIGQFGEELRREIWGKNPRTLSGTSFAPTGKVTPVAGGFRLSGRWSWSSGIDHCEWAAVAGVVPVKNGETSPDVRMFAMPCSAYRIEDVWNAVGMRGTGSNDIVVDDVFVPQEFSVSFLDNLEGKPTEPAEHDPNNFWHSPFVIAFPLLIVGPILGMARGAYETFVPWIRSKANAYSGARVAELTSVQVKIAESAAEIDAAWTLVSKVLAQIRNEQSLDRLRSLEFRARVYRDYIFASQMCVRAVDRLFNASGARGLNVDNPLQRHWRDIHAATAHIGMNAEAAYESFGRTELGLPRNPRIVMY